MICNPMMQGTGSGLPVGAIVLWSGAANAIPAGWHLCDGADGTPDLRGRFVVGAGGIYAVGAKGGAESVTLTAAQMPEHTHTIEGGSIETSSDAGRWHKGSSAGRSVQMPSWATKMDGTTTHYGFDLTTGSASAYHTHTVDLSDFKMADAGGGAAHENRPPYYALCYIMKV